MMRSAILASGLLFAGVVAFAAPASALTMKECSTKYEAAKTANSLNGMSWNDFRKAQCSAEATPTAAPAPAPAAPAATTPATTMAKPKPAATTAPVTAGNVMFPSALSAKYSTESAGKQRMHTCLDQYNANKANGGNGTLKWIQKGGGYYSQCNTRLKG